MKKVTLKEFEKLAIDFVKNSSLPAGYLIQSTNGLLIKDINKVDNSNKLHNLINVVKKLYKKNHLELLSNQNLIEEKYRRKEISLFFLIIVPQITLKGDKSFTWIKNKSIDDISLLKPISLKVEDYLVHLITL
tara:strand:- start:888 stop:1286 length:399 start_codon:yes stop_codon:yes gene_type:complete